MTDGQSLKIECERHGSQDAAVVCVHLTEAFTRPLGFVENSSVPGDYQGWCSACEGVFLTEGSMTDRFKSYNDMQVVCVSCYVRIRKEHTPAL